MANRFKKLVALSLSIIMIMGVIPFSVFADSPNPWDGSIAEDFGEGSGTEDDPYLIDSASQLALLASKVNSGELYMGKYFKLTTDLALNDESFTFMADTGLVKVTDGTNTAYLGTGILGDESGENTIFDTTASAKGEIYPSDSEAVTGSYTGELNEWTPIGCEFYSKTFMGVFDGDNHTITGMYINGSADYTALFGYATKAIIKNIRIESSYLFGEGATASVVAVMQDFESQVNTTVENCYNSATIVSNGSASGIIGSMYLGTYANSYITKCANTGNICGKSLSAGIIASLSNNISGSTTFLKYLYLKYCYNSGDITSSGIDSGYIAGGIIGAAGSAAKKTTVYMNECYNVGWVKAANAGAIYGVSDYISGGGFSRLGCATTLDGKKYFLDSYKTDFTNEYLRKQESYSSFDFEEIWEMDPDSDYPFPTLKGMAHTTPWVEKDIESNGKVWDGKTAPFTYGKGTMELPYLITNAAELNFLKNTVNNGYNYNDCYIKLTTDIILNDETFTFDGDTGMVKVSDGTNITYLGTGLKGDSSGSNTQFDTENNKAGTRYYVKGDLLSNNGSYGGTLYYWTPIGNKDNKFLGNFEGGNHTIYGLHINQDSDNMGFFGYVSGSTITNLRIENAYVRGRHIAGRIVGQGSASMDNCYFNGVVVSSFYQTSASANGVGGIAGKLGSSSLTRCAFKGMVVSYKKNAGGIIGYAEISGEVADCYASGDIYATENAGGFFGYIYNTSTTSRTIKNCYNVCNITAEAAGGFIGLSNNGAEIYNTTFENNFYLLNGAKTPDGTTFKGHGLNADNRRFQPYTPTLLKQKEVYTGFDFANTWSIDPEADYPYPTLQSHLALKPEDCTHNYIPHVLEPTCLEGGYTKHICPYCLDWYYTDIKSKLGHDHQDVVTTPVSCTRPGYAIPTCTRCGDTLSRKEIPELGHNYVAVVTPPTCTMNGYTRHTCSNCGDDYVTDYTNPTGHKYETIRVEPTCEEEGSITYVCHCGDSYEGGKPFAKGHLYDKVVTNPTCTEQGYTTYTCTREECGKVVVSDYVEATGHTHTKKVTKPTCTEQGYTTHTCHCGDSYMDDYVDATGHSHTAQITKPTCTKGGYTTYTCHCGDSYIGDYTDAKGHTEGEWSVVTPAQPGVEGLEEKRCADCGKQLQTRAIEALPLFTLGDINNDGSINKKDYSALKRYCFGSMPLSEIQLLAANVNKDDNVDKKDYSFLKRYCFGTVELN